MTTSLRAVQAKCSQADLEIKARQEEYGIDLYDMIQDHENNAFGKGIVLPGTFTADIKEQWFQANHDIEKYIEKQDKKALKKSSKENKKQRAGGAYTAISVMLDQWVLQRKQKFGVDTFDTAFEILGTTAGNSKVISTLSPQEKELHALVQEAVQDVLLLERLKDSYLQEIQVTNEGSGLIPYFCGAVMCC